MFNTVYLHVTERIGRLLDEGSTFDDGPAMVELDTRFAGLWLAAYGAADTGRALPKAWAPLFSSRHRRGLLPIQFALAGMNTHIEHDLPLAVVRTCEARGSTPDDPTVLADFFRINEVLAAAKRRSGAPSSTRSARRWTTSWVRWLTWSARGASRRHGTWRCSTRARSGSCAVRRC